METIRKLPELISVLITAARKVPPDNVLLVFGVWLVIFALRKIKIRRPRRFTQDDEPTDEADYGTDGADLDNTDAESVDEWADAPGHAEALSPEEDKGRRGEDLIAEILYDTVPGEFEVFRNVYIPSGGATSEADLVMVHERGIFVLESKNYGGWIFGSMGGLNWIQRFPNGRKRSFYNPVRQNRNHIKALSQYLNLPGRQFYSYIVFSDRCALRNVPEGSPFTVVTRTGDLADALRHTLSHAPGTYTHAQIRRIAERLLPLTDVDPEVKARHIEDIRAAWESDTCPFCGGKLVMRRGKYGDFWGCSSYPRCKFKRNVTS